MTSRERILNAINHRAVDRVPVDFGGTRQSGISAFAYLKLRRALGMEVTRPVKVFDLYQMLAEIEPEVAAWAEADCVLLNRPAVAFGIVNEDWKRWRFDGMEEDVLVPGAFAPRRREDGSLVIERGGEAIAEMPAGGFYFDRLEKYPGALHPDLATWSPPRLGEAEIGHYERAARELYDQTDKAVIVAMGPPFELFNGIGQGGFEDWMMTFASEGDYVAELYGKLVDAWIDNLQALERAVGDRVQVLQFADDFGTQHGPFLSTEMFRERLLPAYRRGLAWIHANTDWKVLLHSDGAILPLLDSIVEMGVDILNPVQTTAAGMDPAVLKERYGEKLAFWGASCDSQGTLTQGSPAEVRSEVRANLETFDALAGGFVLASVHNIQANVPPANVIAMFEAAKAFSSKGN